jgi:diaminopimelate decarboxylase
MAQQNPNVIYYPKKAIIEAANKFGTPCFLYSEKRIIENCQNFSNAFTKYFPDFKALYAVKANNNPDIIEIIKNEGFEIDASSESEVWLAEKLGLKGMFTGNYNDAHELKKAKKAGFILNFDDIRMLDFLTEIGIPETLSFRINPGVGKSTMAGNVFAGPNAKYGVPFEKAPEAYKKAQELGVKRFGIHMMTGSNVPLDDQEYFANIIRKLLDIVAQIKNNYNIEIDYLNMGGGFGVPYHPEEPSLDIEALAASVRKAFDEKCTEHKIKEPQLFAEPGRYITADAGWLIGKVNLIKDSYKKFIGLDAGSTDMPRPSIYDVYHHVSIITDETEKENVSIVGRICENTDQFAKDRELPKAKVGDLVVIHNSGGHAFTMSHNYNGRPRSAELLLKTDGSITQIRSAETINDLFRGTKLHTD